MNGPNRIKIISTITVIFVGLSICLMSACQRTPENTAIIAKNSDLYELIKQTAEPETAVEDAKHLDHWELEQEYDSGNRLIIDAEIVNFCYTGVPVLSISEKPFQNGSQLENIVRTMFPDAVVYDQSGKLTKEDIEESILYYKEMLFRADNNLNLMTGQPKSPGETDPTFELAEAYKNDPDAAASATLHDQLSAIIDELEAQLATAPEVTDLSLASYQFIKATDGNQVNLRVVVDGRISTIDFVNWDTGSSFYMRAPDYDSSIKLQIYNSSPNLFANDEVFQQEKKDIDQFLQSIGIDYMSLYSVSMGENTYVYEYVRDFSGFMEVYTPQYLGTVALDANGDMNMNLWKTEHFYIETKNGIIVRAEWINPSTISHIDNENVKILPWETIQDIFMRQMDYILTPSPIEKSETSEGSIFYNETSIYIQRVELGLTKVLMRNSGGAYKLLPTWCFIGYDSNNSKSDAKHNGNEICFLTINAIDGSIIDRGQMY